MSYAKDMTVTLDGSDSYDLDFPSGGANLRYEWTGPSQIEINNETNVNPSFISPSPSSLRTLTACWRVG